MTTVKVVSLSVQLIVDFEGWLEGHPDNVTKSIFPSTQISSKMTDGKKNPSEDCPKSEVATCPLNTDVKLRYV